MGIIRLLRKSLLSFIKSQKVLSRQAEHDRWAMALEEMKQKHKGHVNYHLTNGYNQALEDLKERMK